MNSSGKNELHTIAFSFSPDSKEPNYEYFYGEDKPKDWPIEMHSGVRLTKVVQTSLHQKPEKGLLRRLLSI